MQVVALGDVGVVDGMIHIGDEAMFEVLVAELRARSVDGITALSSAPDDTAVRYGVTAIPSIGFPADREAGATRFSAVLAAIAGARDLPADDPLWAVMDAVAAADGVVIAGGGNLASIWPAHIFERTSLAAIATAHGRPLVVTGQTLGPHLIPADRELVAGLLRAARLVGLREPISARLAADLGTPAARAVLTVDDASFLGFDDTPTPADPFTLVSLSTYLGGRPREAVVTGLAAALDEVHSETGRPTRFHAHFASLDPALVRGDSQLHEEVRSAMATASAVEPTTDSRDAARLARSAGMLVTGRYHPAVFAAPAGVPIAALVVDAYTDVKLRGVLGHWGQTGLIDLDDVASGGATASILSVAAGRTLDRPQPLATMRDRSAAWWDRVVADLTA